MRLRRRYSYRLQRASFAVRRLLPGSLRQVLKSIFRRLSRRVEQQKLAAALSTAGASAADYSILCFPIIDWHWRPQRPQHLASALASAGHRVFYLRTDFEMGKEAASLELLAPNVFGLRLPGPANLDISASHFPTHRLEAWLGALDAVRRAQSLGEVVCLVQLPFWGPLALAARRRWGWRVVYDCMDEYGEFSSTRPAMMAQEPALIAGSDLVVTTARVLYDRCAPLAQRCMLLPNAADFEHFNRPAGNPVLTDLSGQIIGYFGALSEWFELEFVRAAALAHAEWQFALIGLDPGTHLRALERLPNVHLLGEQPYASLPDYLHRFDAVVITFKLTALTRAANPVKFYEYLSAGKPMVAVNLPELEPYRELFYPASTAEEFILQLERALAERDPARVAARVAMARQNIWAGRAAELDDQARRLYSPVTIVIVGNHGPGDFRVCLESVWAKTDYPNFDVLVVDDGSSGGVAQHLQQSLWGQRRLTVIPDTGNLSFARATNLGLAAARGQFVVLLTSDTVVLRGWLSGLLGHLQQDPAVGMIGPVVGWAEVAIQAAPDARALAELEAYAERNVRAPSGTAHEVRALEMVCVALRRAVLDEVGMLDEQFDQGIVGDADYSLRMARAGYRLLRAEDVCVHHWGWAPGGLWARADREPLYEAYRRRFEEKWGEGWHWPPLPPGLPLEPATGS